MTAPSKPTDPTSYDVEIPPDAPIALIEAEASQLGYRCTGRDAKFLLLGYILGRQAEKLRDPEHIRFVTRMLLPDHTPNGNPIPGPDA